jgi:hypothetical protein
MWTVSERFLTAIRNPHKTRTTATITTPGGTPTTVNVKAGVVTVQASSNIRRRGNVTLEGDSSDFELLATPGAQLTIEHGVVYGNSDELIPVFTGEVVDPRQVFGDGTITVILADLGQRVARNRFTTAYQPGGATTRLSAIQSVAEGAFDTLDVTTTATDTGTVGDGKLWAENRWDAIRDLTADGGSEAFFYPDGTFIIRNQPTPSDRPVWTVNAGSGGVLKSAARFRPTSQLFNTVIVRPAATDGSQTWSEQTVTVPVGDPRHPSLIGTAPYFLNSTTILSAADAVIAGQQKLDQLTGMVETLELASVANPALECGDVVRVITPNLNLEPGRAFQHYVESISLDLGSGGMSLGTRSQVVVDG